MSDRQLFSNNGVSLLAAPIDASSTMLAVIAGHGALFPNPSPGEFFLVTLEDQAATIREIIRVNARSGDVFTSIQRAQEGTIARAWSASAGNDTLVDHRITAETLRQALSQPAVQIQYNGVSTGAAASTLNFTGPNVVVVDANGTKTITIDGGASIINGQNTILPVNIDPAWTQTTSVADYSNNQRGFKYFVTLHMPVNHLSSTFEVLGNISGDIDAGTETASWNRTARVGYNFKGSVAIALDTVSKKIELTWQNEEANPVEVMCTRIQHKA